MSDKQQPSFWRNAAKLGAKVALAVGIYIGLLSYAQDKLIYMEPRYSSYEDFYSRRLMAGVHDRQIYEIALDGSLKRAQQQNSSLRPLRLATVTATSSPSTSAATGVSAPVSAAGASTVASPAKVSFAYFIPPSSPYSGRDWRRSGSPKPPRLWLFAGGNAMTALDWLPFIQQYLSFQNNRGVDMSSDFFLLADYPGYGKSSGAPSPQSITNVALEALTKAIPYVTAALPQVQPSSSPSPSSSSSSPSSSSPSSSSPSSPGDAPPIVHVSLFGHSLGCAVALNTAKRVVEMGLQQQFQQQQQRRMAGTAGTAGTGAGAESDELYTEVEGSRVKIDTVYMSAPFTSLLEVAKKVVGPVPFLSYLLRHDFDNQRSLHELSELYHRHHDHVVASSTTTSTSTSSSSQSSSPHSFVPLPIRIIHGTADTICPYYMGEALANEFKLSSSGDHLTRTASSRNVIEEQTTEVKTSSSHPKVPPAHPSNPFLDVTLTTIHDGDHNNILFSHASTYYMHMAQQHSKGAAKL